MSYLRRLVCLVSGHGPYRYTSYFTGVSEDQWRASTKMTQCECVRCGKAYETAEAIA